MNGWTGLDSMSVSHNSSRNLNVVLGGRVDEAATALQEFLLKVEEGGHRIVTPEGVGFVVEATASRQLFIRDCYESILEIVEKHRIEGGKGVLLTGNPGVCKVSLSLLSRMLARFLSLQSWSLMFFLWKYIKQRRIVVFESVAQNESWLFRPGGVLLACFLA
jgi:hypothetical protein